MSEPATTSTPISAQAILMAIRAKMYRRPLWKPGSVMDLLGLERDQVTQKIQNGEFPFAFDISSGKARTRTEPRIFSFSLIEKYLGPDPKIGATRNLTLPEIINLILPERDIRSTELKRIFSCDSGHVHALKPHFVITKKPEAADGPKSFSVFSRASVAKFLQKRRMA